MRSRLGCITCEILLNYLNKELVDYSVKLSGKSLNSFDQRYLITTIRTVSDLERIGDYAENIVEYADALKGQNAKFSDDAVVEIKKMEQLIVDLYNEIMLAYHKLDREALERANMIEDSIDNVIAISKVCRVMLRNRPYNFGYNQVTKVSGFKEFYYKIEERGKCRKYEYKF